MTDEAQHFPAGSPGHPGLPPVSWRKKERNRVLARPTWLLEQQHVSWGSVHGQRAGLLDGAVGSAGHAVAAPGVGKPEVLGRDIQEACISPDLLGKGVETELQPELRRQPSQESFGKGHCHLFVGLQRWFRPLGCSFPGLALSSVYPDLPFSLSLSPKVFLTHLLFFPFKREVGWGLSQKSL